MSYSLKTSNNILRRRLNQLKSSNLFINKNFYSISSTSSFTTKSSSINWFSSFIPSSINSSKLFSTSCSFSTLKRASATELLNKHSKLFSTSSSSPSSSLSSSNSPSSIDFQNELLKKYFDFKSIETPVYSWWESNNMFKPKVEKVEFNKDKEPAPFVVSMPPPNVTGYLHMGHAIFLTLQDVMIRFHRMKGFNTLWIPGTDHAGIATQMLVERQLKSQNILKSDLTREEFLAHVWKWKEEKGSYIINQMKRLGASSDWTREKFTLEKEMNETVTHSFIKLYEEGLIYKGKYMVNWSPVLQTALSDLEVDYVEEEGTLYTFKYPLVPLEGENNKDELEYIPISTTRPETILGDTALCVHPDDERYKNYIGRYARVPFTSRKIKIISDTYVDKEYGTGALKVTPAHDINDYKLGETHGLNAINILTKDGKINYIGRENNYEGLTRFEARDKIWKDLENENLVISKKPHMQRVPRSQRSGEVIEPMISSQWFLKMEDMGRNASKVVRDGKLKIIPSRFEPTWYNWMDNLHDWCISRQLWWGHRIPVYYVHQNQESSIKNNDTEEGDTNLPFVVAKNYEEALAKAKELYGNNIRIEQDEDVLDTWFSSGLWPFATLGWPFLNKDTSVLNDFSRFFPNQIMETGHDILFFWVARMVTLSQKLLNKLPFNLIYLHGLIRDEKGEKMSKTKGNVIDPLQVIEEIGTDSLRFSLLFSSSSSSTNYDLNLSQSSLENGRNFVTKMFNIGKFINDVLNKNENILLTKEDEINDEINNSDIRSIFAAASAISRSYSESASSSLNSSYASPEDAASVINSLRTNLSSSSSPLSLFEVNSLLSPEAIKQLPLLDQVIINQCHRTIDTVTTLLNQHQYSEASRSLYQFLWNDLADWYVEINKIQMRDDENEKNSLDKLEKKRSSLLTLNYVYNLSLRLLHPFIPYLTEVLWQNLPCKKENSSLSLTEWPTFFAPPTYAEYEKNLIKIDEERMKEQAEKERKRLEGIEEIENSEIVDENAKIQYNLSNIESFHKMSSIIRNIRNIRASYSVANNQFLPCLVIVKSKSEENLYDLLKNEVKVCCKLAKLDENLIEISYFNNENNNDNDEDEDEINDKLIEYYNKINNDKFINNDKKLIRKSYNKVIINNNVVLYLPLKSIINKEKEEKKLKTNLNKLMQEENNLSNRLNNSNYIQNAPANIVEQNKKRLNELQEQIKLTQEALQDLNM